MGARSIWCYFVADRGHFYFHNRQLKPSNRWSIGYSALVTERLRSFDLPIAGITGQILLILINSKGRAIGRQPANGPQRAVPTQRQHRLRCRYSIGLWWFCVKTGLSSLVHGASVSFARWPAIWCSTSPCYQPGLQNPMQQLCFFSETSGLHPAPPFHLLRNKTARSGKP